MTGYKGVEIQSLEKDEEYKESTEEEKNKKILDKKLEKYLLICKIQAPYPLNYLACSEDTKHIAYLIGLMIDEELLFTGRR